MATVDSPHPTLPSCIIFRNRRGGSGRPQALRHRDVIEDTSSTVCDFTFFLSRARPPARCDQRRAPPDPRGPEARPSSSRARSSQRERGDLSSSWGCGGLGTGKIRTGREDGFRALKLQSLAGHFKKTYTLQYHFLIRKS